MGLFKATTEASPATPASGIVSGFFDPTTKRYSSIDENGKITRYPYLLTNASVAAVSGAYAVDTYLAGSSITIPTAGDWAVGEAYVCEFDMTKTGAGTGAFTVNVRMGTAAAIGDASVLSLAFAVGTGVIDSGTFRVSVTFRTVGSGTSAVIAGKIECNHHLAATGLITTGASGYGVIFGTSSGFASTTQTAIGLSINGGGSFSGTNTMVQTQLVK